MPQQVESFSGKILELKCVFLPAMEEDEVKNTGAPSVSPLTVVNQLH